MNWHPYCKYGWGQHDIISTSSLLDICTISSKRIKCAHNLQISLKSVDYHFPPLASIWKYRSNYKEKCGMNRAGLFITYIGRYQNVTESTAQIPVAINISVSKHIYSWVFFRRKVRTCKDAILQGRGYLRILWSIKVWSMNVWQCFGTRW